MNQTLVIGTVALVILFGGITYLAAAGLSIIYALGADKSSKERRAFFGILGICMFLAFIYVLTYLIRNGWSL